MHHPGVVPIARMRNLGPASARMLAAIGVHDADDLEHLGAFAAYRRIVDETDHRPSLNLLWAMEGAVLDLDWRDLPEEFRTHLLHKLADETPGDV